MLGYPVANPNHDMSSVLYSMCACDGMFDCIISGKRTDVNADVQGTRLTCVMTWQCHGGDPVQMTGLSSPTAMALPACN